MRNRGFFGKTFDLNKDGRFSPLERVMDIAMYDMMSKESRIKDAGLNIDEIRCMDKKEREKVLKSAGLNPHDYENL